MDGQVRRFSVGLVRGLFVALMGAGVIASASGTAGASCFVRDQLKHVLANAPVAFVGTVTATANDNRTARVHVESVWNGPRLPRVVEVQGSPATRTDVFTSVDRRFRVHQRYLFVPLEAQSARTFSDNACSSTIEYSAAIGRYAPKKPRAPERRDVPSGRGAERVSPLGSA
jgi:hypothetical protein